jgi:hypothetical protein
MRIASLLPRRSAAAILCFILVTFAVQAGGAADDLHARAR